MIKIQYCYPDWSFWQQQLYVLPFDGHCCRLYCSFLFLTWSKHYFWGMAGFLFAMVLHDHMVRWLAAWQSPLVTFEPQHICRSHHFSSYWPALWLWAGVKAKSFFNVLLSVFSYNISPMETPSNLKFVSRSCQSCHKHLVIYIQQIILFKQFIKLHEEFWPFV